MMNACIFLIYKNKAISKEASENAIHAYTYAYLLVPDSKSDK
jgi:hypothetical protein